MFEIDNEYLLSRDLMLQALEMAGVDNWEGYEIAIEIYRRLDEDENNG